MASVHTLRRFKKLNYHLRNIDEATYIKIKKHADENKMSINEIINIILNRAVATNEMTSQNQQIINELNRYTVTNNKLIQVIQEQTNGINNLVLEINKMIRQVEKMREKKGRRRTWYVNDNINERLEEIRDQNRFNNMNQVITYLLDIEKEVASLKDQANELKNDKQSQLNIIDKNIEIMLEIITWNATKSDIIPPYSYHTGLNRAYFETKEIVEKHIEQQTKANREQRMFQELSE